VKLLRTFLLCIALAGCAQTPVGKRVDAYQYTDMATTAIALTQDGVSEVNPLFPYIIPFKLYAGTWIEKMDCKDAQQAGKILNTITGAAIANNLFVIMGVAPAALYGIITGGIVSYLTDPAKCSD